MALTKREIKQYSGYLFKQCKLIKTKGDRKRCLKAAGSVIAGFEETTDPLVRDMAKGLGRLIDKELKK